MSDQAVPGKKIRRLPADQWNDMAAAARFFRESRLSLDSEGGGFDYPEPGFIKIRNDTGSALPRFSIVAIGDPWTTPSLGGSTLDVFKTRKTCSASVPAEANRGKFAILVDGCAPGGVVDAIASGVVQCQVQVDEGEEDYVWADIEPDSTAVLHAATSGSARILWKESGTGTKWAQVRLSNRVVASSIPVCYFHTARVYRPTDGYRSANDIKYSRSPGSLYWVNSMGDVSGCNLTVNTAAVTAYTDWALKVGVAGYYEIEFQCTAYDITSDTDKGYYEATTDSAGAISSHSHTFTGTNGNTDSAATHKHGLSALGAYETDLAGSHTHSITPAGTLDSAGSVAAHTHTVRVPQGRDGISSGMYVYWRPSGGGEGDLELAACAWAQFRALPCLNQSYLGTYASAAPRAILYLPANAELLFRVGCNVPAASASQYDDAACAITNYPAFTNCTIKFHGTSIPTATHYP